MTRTIGALSEYRAFSDTRAASSAPNPQNRAASWTMTARPVFSTESMTAFYVERHEGAEVDHLGGNAVRREHLGGFESDR